MLIRLETTDKEKILLLNTMRQYNKAANYVSERAFELKIVDKYQLQKLLYRQIREQFGLTAQLAIRVISKVVEAYKHHRNTKSIFRELGAIQFDQRNLSWKGLDKVSITTTKGRIKLRTKVGECQRIRANKIRGQADLIYRNGVFYLIAVAGITEELPYDPKETLGVDLGIENIATDSDNQVFKGDKIELIRRRYNRLRTSLQRRGTSSAKRKLKKMSGREKRFKRDVNHQISKTIVSKAKGTTRAIAIENLKGIRSRVTVRHEQRSRHNRWSFGQLRQFIEYKARREGVPLYVVEPANTSRECPKCHYIDKRNRPERNIFRCILCRYEAMADFVAATNIAARAANVNQPIVTPLFSAVTNPQTG
jgi:putative transposase